MMQITPLDLEGVIKSNIRDYELTHKAYTQLRTILRGTFRYAYNRGWTTLDINAFFGYLELPKSMFARKKVKQDVYTLEERTKMIAYLRKNPDRINLGILLTLQTGMRVGELVVLKWDDVTNDYIHIQRTEASYKDPDGVKRIHIQDEPKTGAGNRYVILSDTAKETVESIRKLDHFGEYIFMSDNGIIVRGNTVSRRIKNICEKIGIHMYLSSENSVKCPLKIQSLLS